MTAHNVTREIWGSADPIEIKSSFDATDLTARIQDFRRDRVIIVITPNQAGKIMFDPAAVAQEVGDRAEVVVIRDPDLTFVLTNELPDRFNVFNGAARIYPRGVAWLADIQLAPIFFAPDQEMADRRRPALIEKAITLSYVAPRDMMGIKNAEPLPPLTPRRAPVPAALIPPPAAPTPSQGLSPTHSDLREVDVEELKKRDLTIAARDQSITERDHTITLLTDDLRDEHDRVMTVTGLLVASQTEFRAAISRWQRTDSDIRALTLENGELKKKTATQLKLFKEQLAGARKKTPTVGKDVDFYDPERFSTKEDAIRFAVLQAWVERIPSTEKAANPLPQYLVGDHFTESFEEFGSPAQAKILKCVVDILVGAPEVLAMRQVHPLRRNASASILTRQEDDAKCYRAYVEEGTAGARRLHFWKHNDGTVELSRTVVHDDYEA